MNHLLNLYVLSSSSSGLIPFTRIHVVLFIKYHHYLLWSQHKILSTFKVTFRETYDSALNLTAWVESLGCLRKMTCLASESPVIAIALLLYTHSSLMRVGAYRCSIFHWHKSGFLPNKDLCCVGGTVSFSNRIVSIF